MDSHSLQPPFLGKQQPLYPHLMQAVRVTTSHIPGPITSVSSSSITGPVLYISYTQQLDPTTLRPRDREPCLVTELNGNDLSAGYYTDCRLAGSYNGLPLYEVGNKTCADTAIRISCVSINWDTSVLTVRSETYDICTGEVLSVTCEDNPDDCCGDITSPCCPNNPIPSQLCITFTDALAELGDVDLTYDTTTGYWQGAGPGISCCPGDEVSGANTYVAIHCNGAQFVLLIICNNAVGNLLFNKVISFDCVTATGSGTDNVTGSPGVGPCEGGTFTYSIVPGTCSGSGSGGGTISTACCVAGLQSTLYITLFNTSGCACMAGTFPITWQGSQWAYGPTIGACGGLLGITLACFAGNWLIGVSCANPSNTIAWTWMLSPTCVLPLTLTDVVGTVTGTGTPCCTGTIHGIITE